jgi:hypothetical protein
MFRILKVTTGVLHVRWLYLVCILEHFSRYPGLHTSLRINKQCFQSVSNQVWKDECD